MTGTANQSLATKTWTKRFLLGAGLLLVLGVLVLSAMPKPIPVEIGHAERGEMTIAVDESGRTRVKDRHVVSAPLTARLARIELEPGDPVQAGDVLARLMPLAPPLLDQRTRAQADARVAAAAAAQQQARAAVDRARAALDFATEDLSRQRTLTRQGATAGSTLERASVEERTRQAELTSARFARRVADSELSLARAARGRLQDSGGGEQLEVPAPVDGVVLRVLQESEGVVQTGAPLVEVGNPAALEIVIDVLTADAVTIEPGASVTLSEWGGPNTLQGHVRRIEPSAFSEVSALGVEEQRVNVVVDIDTDRDAWASLGDGFRVEAAILVSRLDNVLRIPSSALFRNDGGWHVFVVREETAVLSAVEVGVSNGVWTEIVGGLENGQTVILHPSDEVADQSAVRPRLDAGRTG